MGDALAIDDDSTPTRGGVPPPTPGARSPHLPPGRPRLTDRDYDILEWVTRHGMVTSDQIARRFFRRDGAAIGKRRAYQRIAELRGMRLLQTDPTYSRSERVIRATRDGARLANVGLRPAVLRHTEVTHALSLVDLLDALETALPEGTEVVTERELRAQWHREIRAGERQAGEGGRMPDGVVVLPDGQRVAIELDLTTKRVPELVKIVEAYNEGAYDAVWCYVVAGRSEHVQQVVQAQRADDYIEVREWHST